MNVQRMMKARSLAVASILPLAASVGLAMAPAASATPTNIAGAPSYCRHWGYSCNAGYDWDGDWNDNWNDNSNSNTNVNKNANTNVNNNANTNTNINNNANANVNANRH